MLELLSSPGGVIGALCGLAIAAIIHWLFPALADTATVLYAGLVAVGFLVGLVLEHASTRK